MTLSIDSGTERESKPASTRTTVLRTHVEFQSDKFPAYDGEEDKVNPVLFGRHLAEYLHDLLPKFDIIPDEIIPEDWGWIVPIRNESFPMWIACGSYADLDDGFLCFIEPSKPQIRRFFRKIDTTEQVAKVAAALDAILTSDPEIAKVRWWTDDESVV